MLNPGGKKQVLPALRLAGECAEEAWRDARYAVHHLQVAAGACYCALTGRHAWGEWRRTQGLFTPPEARMCKRCTAHEFRGRTPEVHVVVEAGSLEPRGKAPRFLWTEDGGL